MSDVMEGVFDGLLLCSTSMLSIVFVVGIGPLAMYCRGHFIMKYLLIGRLIPYQNDPPLCPQKNIHIHVLKEMSSTNLSYSCVPF